jgi:hypothetical protein
MVTAAKRLGIQAPIQANNELATIFMDLCVENLLLTGGRVAMVMPRTILESSSLDKWRVLRPYQEVRIWVIDESVFPVPAVVFFGRKMPRDVKSEEAYSLPVSKAMWSAGAPEEALMKVMAPESWVPYHIDWNKDQRKIIRVRKWVPVSSLDTPVERSEYYAQAEKGANIGPITFISLSAVEPQNEDLVMISPDLDGGKVPFANSPYDSATVESRYVFPYVKSKQLLPFGFTRTLHCFLPVQVVTNHYELDTKLAPHAAAHWTMLACEYAALRAVPAGKDLFSHYLNHKHHLESPKMLVRFKVAFNEGGQRVKAALLREAELVEHTLVFVPVETEDEGLYLTGILNSSYISEFFAGPHGRGSARHVSLRPLELPIPPLDLAHPTLGEVQLEIIAAARLLESHVKELIENHAAVTPPSTLEKRARAYYPSLWAQLNAAVLRLFHPQ